MTAGWCSRTVRAAVFAAVCVLLAALGHVMMSGRHVPWWALAAGMAVTGVAGWSLAGRERGLPLIVTVVVVAQTVLHEAFSLAQSASGGTASMDMGSMPMDSMDMGSMGTGGTGHMDHMAHMGHSMGGGSSSFGMLAAHLLAALLCGLWLAYGERAAFRILRAVGARLAAPLRLLLALPVTPVRPGLRVRRRRSHRAPRLLLLVHSIISRGPPAGVAVA
ncbi:hypothetical protein AQI88_17535 [Streptomyces cellostaticus]|uniref:Integral membrane protein n=1 Tax=Streptomyces cellostaticus TaxID=67285 RepID=A0A124HCU1_9ACTN|nr:hypothetical protein [Streptomyces cellostaticus]KUM95422.1 hypothetical protein AQI88_17535 [Streptomyces cellostaticus]GHI01977.1 hypothetical protein Scel_02980 [Streptomyces cellostaticus]